MFEVGEKGVPSVDGDGEKRRHGSSIPQAREQKSWTNTYINLFLLPFLLLFFSLQPSYRRQY